MSKRRSDTQLTKDDYESQMNGGFGFSANRGSSEGGPDDQADPSKMADSKVLMGRKIAPLKKGRGRGGAATGSRGTGSSIPNFFAGTPNATFGSNGTAQQPADGGMFGGSFGAPSAAPAGSTGFATGGFQFGGNNNAPEQPKVNPFGSLVPSTPATPNGSGGMFTQQPQMGSNLFGNSPAPQAATPGGMFGSNNNTASPAPASGGFVFGGNNNNTASTAPSTSFTKASTFNFGGGGGGSPAPPVFGGDNKPAASTPFSFGSSAATPAVTPPATSSFNFGGSAATAPANTGYFGAPSPAPEKKTPEPPSTPAAPPPSFQFLAATPAGSPAPGMFGKPVDQQGLSLFGRPSPSPEPSSNLFAPKPAASPEPSLFGSPAPAPAQTNNFFAQPKAQEQPKPLFGFGDKQEPAKDVPAPFFGGFGSPAAAKKEEPSKPLFGFAPVTEKKQEPPKETPKSPFSFGTPAHASTPSKDDDDDVMDENSPPKQSVYDSQPVNNNSFSGFGQPKPAFAAAPTNQNQNQFTPPPMFAPTTTKATTATTTNVRTPSPPIPSDATSWSPTQLTEYYNLYALRALNFTLLESLKGADPLGDWSTACELYIRESERIKSCQQNGERYKGVGADSKSVSNKRNTFGGGSDGDVEGGGKRRKDNSEDLKAASDSSKALAGIIGDSSSGVGQKLASKPVFGFKPPTAGASTTSGPKLANAPVFGFKPPAAAVTEKKLASKPVHGFAPPTDGASTASGPKLSAKPLFGFQPPAAMTEKKPEEKKTGGSVFDNPSAPVNNGGFVNPFTTKKPDPNEKDMDDDDSDGDDKQPSGASSAGSLFGRISEPKASTSVSGSIFNTPTKSSTGGGLFSNKLDQTWSPDNGLKFAAPPANGNGNGPLFGAKSSTETKPSLFSTGSSASSAVTTPGASATSSMFGTPGPKTEVGFSFGGNGTTKPSGAISIPSSSAVSRDTSATPDDSASEPNDNAHLAKNEVDLSAQGPGEEDEDSLFQVRAIIYERSASGESKKAGVGTLRVLKNRITKKARVITRTEGGKVVLNVGLVKEVSYLVGAKGGKNVNIVEFLPQGKPPKHYTVRVKEEEKAKELGEIMEDAKMGS